MANPSIIVLYTIAYIVINLMAVNSTPIENQSLLGLNDHENCFDNDADYLGFDLDDGVYVSTESASACQDNCQQTKDCLFWTWDPNYHRACWRKSGKGETRRTESLVSGPKFCDGGETTTEPTPPSPDLIKVLSYNLFGVDFIDHCHGWKLEAEYETIRAINPDLFAAQEIGSCYPLYAENLDYAVAGASAATAGHAILYRSSMFDVNNYGFEYLQPRDAYGRRTVEYAHLTHKQSGRLVDHFNTHFCVCEGSLSCCGADKGLEAARNVEDAMTKHRRPGSIVFLTGDLNVFEGFEKHIAIQYLKGESKDDLPPVILKDTFREVNDNSVDGSTFGGAGKIDYVFTNLNTTVISASIDRIGVSDHFPINAVIKIN